MQQQDAMMFMVMERLNMGASSKMLEQQRMPYYFDQHHQDHDNYHHHHHHHHNNQNNMNHQDMNSVANRIPQLDPSYTMTPPSGLTPSMPTNATYAAKQHDSCALSALHSGRNHQHHQHHPTHILNNNKQQRKKAKRIRTTFTPEQLKRLEDEFSHQPYLVGQYRQFLATTLGLTEGQVKVWFQNRRIKQRKNELK